MKMFEYNRSSIETSFNDIVDGALEQVSKFANKESKGAEYKKFTNILNKNFVKYAVRKDERFSQLFEEKGTAIFKSPEVTNDSDVRKQMNAVIAQVVNASLPMTASNVFSSEFIDIHHVGWGDTARFLISSNDLFMVNEIGEGIRRGVLQPIFNDEITVNCTPYTIDTSINFYEVAAGVFDWGQFGYRAGRSLDGFILAKAVAALTSATGAGGATPYSIAGFDEDSWTALANRVKLANNGATAYAVGTITALSKVLPSTVGLQYGLGEEIAKDGYLSRFRGVTVVPMDQAMVPGTVNSSAELALPDDMIYMVGAGQDSPIKVVFEGDNLVVEQHPTQTSDKTYRINIQVRIGIAAVVGAKYGAITLN